MKQKGFTLIELLVVISIIGLLSSVVLASLNTARDRARVAAGQKFDTHTYRSLGADTAASYTFDDAVGNVAYDRSGNGIDLNSSGNTFTINIEGFRGKALQFNGTTNYARSTRQIKIEGGKWTIAAWIKPMTLTAPTNFPIFFAAGFPYMGIVENKLFARWYNTAIVTQSSNVLCPSSMPNLKIDVWTHAAVTSTGSQVALFVDGKEVCRVNSAASIAHPNGIVGVGNYIADGYPYNGLVDEPSYYAQSLLASEIREIYLAGLPSHPIASK